MERRASTKLSRSGGAVGFTAAGEAVCARYMRGSRAWRVWCATDAAPAGRLTDERTQQIPSATDAAAYVASLIDAAVTQRLAWCRAHDVIGFPEDF